MGLDIDLAALAGMAGLGGSAVAATGAAIFFKGLLMRILAQLVVTAGLSFVGFIALFNFLGFTIVPKSQAASSDLPPIAGQFAPQSAAPAADPTTYVIRSPWSKPKDE
jgi:hypothetical protein